MTDYLWDPDDRSCSRCGSDVEVKDGSHGRQLHCTDEDCPWWVASTKAGDS